MIPFHCWKEILTHPRLESHQVKRSEHDVIYSPIKVDQVGMPVCSAPCDDDESNIIQGMELDPKVATNPLLEIPSRQGSDSGYFSNHHETCDKTAKDFPDPKDSWFLNLNSHSLESEPNAEYNIDRWFQEPVDLFEVTKRALVETLSSEPELATFAIPLFESQWKLESFAMSPGVVSCVTEDTPAQTYTPSSSQSSTSKRKVQSQWRGSSQPDRVPGEEDEEEEEPQQKRQKGSKDLEDGHTKRKFGCFFHKRHPTIYCLSKDPNMGTKEQKKWSVCGGQGFPYLRHLM
jgi:hypothetical protein